MELREPRSKKKYTFKNSFPQSSSKNVRWKYKNNETFNAQFNGFSVILQDYETMKKLNDAGCYGKTNVSKYFPTYPQKNVTEIIRKRQFERRKLWGKQFVTEKKKQNKVIVVPDSDSEKEDDYFVNLKPEFQIDSSELKETLNLNLEESFYLQTEMQCLRILNVENKALMTSTQTWELFCDLDKYFIQNFVVYRHFRNKNWILKPGLKFGGDFLLYKEGPSLYHASYLVIIDVIDSKTYARRDDLCRRDVQVKNVIGLNRLCETAGKELLICQLMWPASLISAKVNDIEKININEILLRRWMPSQKQEKEAIFDSFNLQQYN